MEVSFVYNVTFHYFLNKLHIILTASCHISSSAKNNEFKERFNRKKNKQFIQMNMKNCINTKPSPGKSKRPYYGGYK